MKDYKNRFMGLIVIASCFVGSISAVAAESENGKFTLPESVAIALEQSLSLDSAERTIEKAEYDKNKAYKNFLPVLSGTYSYTKFDNEASTTIFTLAGARTINISPRDLYQGKLTLSQPIFTGFKLKSSYELAKLGIDVAKVQRETEKLDIILDVKRAYLGILEAEKAIEIADQAIKKFEALLYVAQNFYKVGMTTKNQVLESEANLAEAVQGKIRADNQLSLAKANFNTLLRRPINSQVEVEDILAYKPYNYDFPYCLEQAMQIRPEIKAVLQTIEIAKEKIRLARADYFPSVALTANHTWRGDNFLIDGGDLIADKASWDATVVMSWEFWNWLQPRDAVRSSNIDLMKAYNSLTQLKDGIQLEVKNFFLSLKEAEKQIGVAEKAIKTAEENHRMSEERYKAQVATSTEVIDATTLLTSARINYYRALVNYNLAWATLERAMGLGRDRI
jgi:outer membrane protein TolC